MAEDVAIPGDDADHADRVAAAWALRAAGRTYAEVARAFGRSVSTVHGWVQQADEAEQARALGTDAERRRDLTTTDALLARCVDAANAGTEPLAPVVGAATGLLRHRARLLGLDRPVRSEVVMASPRSSAISASLDRRRRERLAREQAEVEAAHATAAWVSAPTATDHAADDGHAR